MNIIFSKALCSEAMQMLETIGELHVANDGNPENYLELMHDADALVLRIGKINANVIAQSPNLKVIGRTGVGYDNVDVKAATAAGIPVVFTPGANTRSVAEHTLALIFAAAKNLIEAQNETALGHFTTVRDNGKAFELFGKTIGIIGLGAIGRVTAQLCSAIGMKCVGYDPYLSQEQIESLGCGYADTLEHLLPVSDVVTIHVPLVAATRGLIGKKELALMKKTAVIVNCSRGGIIDESALVDALNTEQIAGAGIDVFVTEPVRTDDPLIKAKNLVFSPHSAAMTREAARNMGVQCAEGCMAVLRGERWPHVANPEVYNHPLWKSSE